MSNENDSPQKRSQSRYAGQIVRIIDYDMAKHAVKVVKKDNQPLEKDKKISGDIKQEKQYEVQDRKFLKTSRDPKGSIIEVTHEEASIRGSNENGFFSMQKHGNIIKGPLSITAQPHEIRLSMFTKLNPLITSGFASTIVNPIPTTIFSLPAMDGMKVISEGVAMMTVLLSAGGLQ